MAWRDDLRTASFRGVSFSVEGATIGAGRRLARHEYPQRDIPYLEDMGRKAREYKVDAFIVGDDYMQARDRLLDAIEKPGAGQLIHPYHGNLLVTVSDCNLTESNQHGGLAKFSINFVEAGKAKEPDQATDTEGVLDVQYEQCQADFAEEFAENFSVDGLPDFAVDDALGGLNNIIAMPGVSLGSLPMLRANPLSSLYGLLPENLLGALADPLALARGVLALIDQASDVAGLLGFDMPQIPNVQTPSRMAQNKNRAALSGLVLQGSSARRVMDLCGGSFPALDDARLARAEVVSRADDVLFNPFTGDRAGNAITQLRTDAVGNFMQMMPSLPKLITATPKVTRPALVTAHDMYGDRWLADAREGEIIGRNKIRHPGFVPAGRSCSMVSA